MNNQTTAEDREDALDFALRAKKPDDTYEDVIEAAKAYADWIVNGAPDEVASTRCDAANLPSDPNVDSGLPYADASQRAKDLLTRGSLTGSWFDLPERLIGLRDQMKVHAFKRHSL